MNSSHRKWWLFAWMIGYVALATIVVGSMLWERHAVLQDFGTPEAIANWRAWRGDVAEHQAEPGPVQRQVPKSDEPPALVLMRDYFKVSMVGAVFFTSLLYWIMAWFISGALHGTNPPHRKSAATG
ncbi:MAG TPA: hypothetical protein VHU84_16145 [Lacipirellulaceae bacterium]|nr:hypothetical protein [Lacipirellulaceae bacterium]